MSICKSLLTDPGPVTLHPQVRTAYETCSSQQILSQMVTTASGDCQQQCNCRCGGKLERYQLQAGLSI